MKFKILTLILFSFTALGVFAQCNLEIQYKLDGFVLEIGCSEAFDEPMHTIEIESITGGSELYSIAPIGNGIVSNTLATNGNGFIYYFTEDDQTSGNLGFTITDGGSDTCYLDNVLDFQISSIPFFCDSSTCAEKIALDVEPGDIYDIFSCNANGNLQIKVNDITGGNGSFAVNSLGLGNIIVPNILNNKKFNFEIVQSDIETELSQVGFEINDGENCSTRFDFSGQLAFSDIESLCYVASSDAEILQNEALEIRPNIVSRHFEIYNASNKSIQKVQILSTNGKLIQSFDYNLSGFYNINNLSKGVYFVLIGLGDATIMKKIIKN